MIKVTIWKRAADAATAADWWVRSAAAYGGYHPADMTPGALAAAMLAHEQAEAATQTAINNAWGRRCSEPVPTGPPSYPPQAIRTAAAWELRYGAGRSEAVLRRAGGAWEVALDATWTPYCEFHTVDEHRSEVRALLAEVAEHWHLRLAGWAGEADPGAWERYEAAKTTVSAGYGDGDADREQAYDDYEAYLDTRAELGAKWRWNRDLQWSVYEIDHDGNERTIIVGELDEWLLGA